MDSNLGSYAALYLNELSNRRLRSWSDKNLKDVAEVEPLYDYHITICYSVKPVDYVALGRLAPLPITPKKFSLFGKDKSYLVLEVESKLARNRQEYSKILGAVSDFPDYKPHISLAKNFKGSLEDLEPFNDILYTGREETTPLNPSYSPDKMRIAPQAIQQIIRDYRQQLKDFSNNKLTAHELSQEALLREYKEVIDHLKD